MKKIIFIIIGMFFAVTLYGQSNYKYLEKAAENGDLEAQKYLGVSFLIGNGNIPKNIELSYKWLLRAAGQGDSESQYILGTEQELSIIVENSKQNQMFWLEKAAMNNHPNAIEIYGNNLINNRDTKAFVFFEKMANEEYGEMARYDGIKFLGDCYLFGIGTSQNIHKALECYFEVKGFADFLSQDAKLISLANRYYRIITPNIAEFYTATGDTINAIKMYEKYFSVDSAKIELLTEQGWLYYGTKEYKKAMNSFVEAEKKGLHYKNKIDVAAEGCNGQAYLYAKGYGVPKNMNRAFELIDNAIKISTREKQYRYIDSKGEFYLIEGNMDKAREMWEKVLALNPDAEQSQSTLALAMMNSIDNNIPESFLKSDKTFVLVIANEDYKRVAPVPFAKNDGSIFAEYCKKTLGVPEKNVYLVENATLGDIKYHINLIKKIAEAFDGEARIIFYYAGHGIPDEAQRTSYLLPVDGYGNDATSGYSLENLYTELANIPAKSTMVFMDACFSGAQRDGSMIVEARGVAIKPKEDIPTGKLIVFSAAQGDETAYPYAEKKHGMFTYYLLKKLQDTKGDTTLGELMNYVTKEVKQQSVLQNKKSQTPKVTPSQSVADTWQNMKLK